ncbi:hypothetical protein [Chamaesiphon sp. OTE_8_metabat_110]|uniref:NACHT domain-containing protein n=1 Tax=Chamaesiphon sp. OTE_8_metabat_110 TaxID=2964696 RepID=UPI00286C1C0B|nr:hypothetical protein [Chamaesiphon sp. OTE_8_metabat_110]
MSGSGGGGGYEYQARATAYVAVHILTQQKLGWIDTADDIPVSVAVETGGAGDDLAITLQNGIIIELQAKHGLQKNKLWEPIVKLAQGLQENPSLYGILLTDSTASKVIREELRKDLQRLGQGRTDRLKTITQELQQKLSESNISSEPDLFRRLSIRVLDLDDGLQNSESACKMLPQVLENQNQASTAWKIFWGEGLNLTTNRGRRDATAWARLLSNESIQLASDKQNPAVISEIYRTWLQETTSHLIVPGIREKFSMQSDWLSLRAKQYSGEQEPFNAKFIPELYPLSIVAGEPGSGKSTFTKYLSHHLASLGKTVLRVRLPSVCKLLGSNEFEDAILRAAAGNSSLSLEQSQFALSKPDYLLADGLDECGDNRAVISEKLRDWANGQSTTRIIVTTRIDSEPEYLPGWQLLKLLPLEDSDTIKFAKRLLGDSFDEAKFKSWLQTSESTSLAAKNPLLLGFLIQIFREHDEPIQNRAKLYEKIIDLAYKQLLQDKDPISLEEPTAKRIIEIVGWELLNNPQCSERELWNNVGEKLEYELNVPSLEAKNQAKKGVLFWEQRRILERINIGCDDVIVFLHLTIGEYAAGGYACEMEDNNFYQWLIEVNQNHMWREPTLFAIDIENAHDFPQCLRKAKQNYRWRESILFAADLGKAETIINFLLQQVEDEDENKFNEILFAVEVLRKSTDSPVKLVKKVIERLKNGLESPTQSIVFKTADILLSLSLNAPELIGTVSQPYLLHSQSWTRLAAITLSLGSGNECVFDVNEIEEQIDKIILEAEQKRQCSSPSKNIFSLRPRIDNLKIQFLIKSFVFLLQEQPSLENCHRMKKSFDLVVAVKKSDNLREVVSKKLIESSRTLENKSTHLSQKVTQKELCKTSRRILFDLYDPMAFIRNFERLISDAKVKLGKLKSEQQNKSTDRLFLESIIRVLKYSSISILPDNTPQHFVLLGILTKGMGYWDTGIQEWEAIGQYPIPEVVNAVIEGAIVAMDLDRQKLATEAKVLLDRLERHFHYEDLDEIEFILANPTGNLDKFNWACDRLSNADLFLCRSIPQGEHPTFYSIGTSKPFVLVEGLRNLPLDRADRA